MSELYLLHTYKDGATFCGAPDPGPLRWGEEAGVRPCLDCMSVTKPIPDDQTMRAQLERARASLRRKLRTISESHRAEYLESIRSFAAASMADPTSQPARYGEAELLAAMYALGAVRGGYFHMKRAGVRPTWKMLEQGLDEMEMILVAVAEGAPGG